jgi:uncharacterized membrane protein YozB (DUF420 family)
MLHLISTLVLVLVAGGVYYRRQPRVHLRFMLAAFVVDLSLVLYIEVARHAVERVLGATTGLLLWCHVAVSVAVLCAYGVQIQLGRRMLRGFSANRRLHVRLGMTFCALRLLNYITSFMVT